MSEQLTHSVPLFEGRSSRRHQMKAYEELRSEAGAYAASDTAPDLAGVRTLVQFAGFPRSGHSLVGSLIDAHPDAVVAHELDLMGLLGQGLDRGQLFSLICSNSAEFERHGRWWNGFSYRVAGSAGGASPRPVVLGDKKADWAVRRAARDPGLLAALDDVMGDVRAAWIVVVRNPYDNIATMSLRAGRAYDRIRISAGTPQEFRRKLERAQGRRVTADVLPDMVEDYAALCEGVASMRDRVPARDWFELRHEELVADPATLLERLFAFVGLPVTPDFLRTVAASVHTQVNRSRHQVRWSPEALARVQQLTAEQPFLKGYELDGD